MEALNLLVEKHGAERVLKAVNNVAEEWRWELRICCKCGSTLYMGDGFLGDGGWRCRQCGLKERNWRWGETVEMMDFLKGRAKS